MSASAALLDMEDPILGADEMAGAVYMLLERGASTGLSQQEVISVIRCVVHLQDHTAAIVRDWKVVLGEVGIGA